MEGKLRDFPGRAYLALLFRSDTQDWWGTILNLLLVTLGSIEFGSKQPGRHKSHLHLATPRVVGLSSLTCTPTSMWLELEWSGSTCHGQLVSYITLDTERSWQVP